jgi:DSBA-like thioredoxin domain
VKQAVIKMQVQFVLDYRSPYAYLANAQIASLGAQVSYEPVDILSVMKEVNNQPSPMCPPKAKYAGLDATRWAKHYGVPFSPNMALLAALRQGDLEMICFRVRELQDSCSASSSRQTTPCSARFGRAWMICRLGGTVAICRKPRSPAGIVGHCGLCRGRKETRRQQ